ncbi:MAG: HTH domain-containing protein [Cytophagales bacterium]|nr:HTH domain-containing protein [Cytophagales bacterium]
MALQQIIKRYLEIDRLITNQQSGDAEELAKTLGISKRQVYNYLNAMQALGRNVKFNPRKRTYTYLVKKRRSKH